jgi:predicted RNase H-like nuclease (RuvC/YqgF family)
MTNEEFDRRIAKLTERHEALTLSIEHLAIESAKHDRQIEELIQENRRAARESRLFRRFVLNMGLSMDERIAKLEQDDGQEPSAA